MKRIVVILICFIPLLGCDRLFGGGENFPEIPDIVHYTIIENNSSHVIEVEAIWEGEIYPYTLYPDQRKVFDIWLYEYKLPYFPTLGDTAQVIYDDSITVLHTKQDVQDVSRSIMLRSSFTGGKVNDKLYEIYYTFTDVDYEEAVVLNGGG